MGELRPGWKRVKFGQMAVSVNDRVDDPTQAGVDHYVGLEHLEPGSLKIRRWGSPSDVSATKLLFEPGDVIFARRRAYQRKLGVAEFRGIASAHSLVLRAKPAVVLPNFLPFFMQSDIFMERAQEISVGSLSPTINWKTLATQEFALPPLVDQRRLVQLFRRVEDNIDALAEASKGCQTLKVAVSEDFVQRASETISLDEVLQETAYGSSTRASSERGRSEVPILRIPNVLRDEIDLADLKYVELAGPEIDRYRLEKGDVLLVRTNGNPDYVGRAVVVGDLPEVFAYASYLIRLRFRQATVLPAYVVAMLNSPSVRRRLRGSVRSSAGNYNLNTQGIRRQEVPDASVAEQQEFVDRLSDITRTADALVGRMQELRRLKARLLVETL